MEDKFKEYNKPIRVMIVKSQHDKIFELKEDVRNKYGLIFHSVDMVKIAINELLENNSNDKDLENLLEKYNYI